MVYLQAQNNEMVNAVMGILVQLGIDDEIALYLIAILIFSGIVYVVKAVAR